MNLNLIDLLLWSFIALSCVFVWMHLEISRRARELAENYCEKQNVVLLDQSVILKKLGVCRSPSSLFAIRRLYQFEFSTVGDARYQGCITFVGKKLQGIEMDAFRM